MKLDDILAVELLMNDVNTFEKSFTESIRQAGEDVIPKSINSSKTLSMDKCCFFKSFRATSEM